MDHSSPIKLSADVRNKWIKSWNFATLQNDGKSFSENIKLIFMQSGLSNDTLARVWTLVDQPPSEKMSLHQFFCAMYILNVLRDGKLSAVPAAIPPELDTAVRLALETPAENQLQRSPTEDHVASMSGSKAAASIEISPEISPKDWALYQSYFASLDAGKRGFLTGDQVRPFLMRSKLSEANLAYIWELVDIAHKGVLNSAAFAIVMHAVKAYMANPAISSSGLATATLPHALKVMLEASVDLLSDDRHSDVSTRALSGQSSPVASPQPSSAGLVPSKTFPGAPAALLVSNKTPSIAARSMSALSASESSTASNQKLDSFGSLTQPWTAKVPGAVPATDDHVVVNAALPVAPLKSDTWATASNNALAAINADLQKARAQAVLLQEEKEALTREVKEQQQRFDQAKVELNAELDAVALLESDVKILKHELELATAAAESVSLNMKTAEDERDELRKEQLRIKEMLEDYKAQTISNNAAILAVKADIAKMQQSLERDHKVVEVEKQMFEHTQSQLSELALQKASVRKSEPPPPPPRMKSEVFTEEAPKSGSEGDATMRTAYAAQSPEAPASAILSRTSDDSSMSATTATPLPATAQFKADDFAFDANFDAAFPPIFTEQRSVAEESPSQIVFQASPAKDAIETSVASKSGPASSDAADAAFDAAFGQPSAAFLPNKDVNLISIDSSQSASAISIPKGKEPNPVASMEAPINLLAPPSDQVIVLLNMGFSRKQSENALARYDNNLEKATNFLLGT